MSAIDTLRDALFGNPPQPNKEPSREGVLAAFTDLFDQSVVAMYAAQAGLTTVPDIAARDAFFSNAENQGKLVYVNDNNGSDSDPANGVYEYVDGAARIATGFYTGVTASVQPLIDAAESAATRAQYVTGTAALNGLAIDLTDEALETYTVPNGGSLTTLTIGYDEGEGGLVFANSANNSRMYNVEIPDIEAKEGAFTRISLTWEKTADSSGSSFYHGVAFGAPGSRKHYAMTDSGSVLVMDDTETNDTTSATVIYAASGSGRNWEVGDVVSMMFDNYGDGTGYAKWSINGEIVLSIRYIEVPTGPVFIVGRGSFVTTLMTAVEVSGLGPVARQSTRFLRPDTARIVNTALIPDGALAQNPNGGFTCTGADQVPAEDVWGGCWIVGNHGQATVGSAPYTSSVVMLDPARRVILREWAMPAGAESVQGVARGFEASTFWVVDKRPSAPADSLIRLFDFDGNEDVGAQITTAEIVAAAGLGALDFELNGIALNPVEGNAGSLWIAAETKQRAYLFDLDSRTIIRTITGAMAGAADQLGYDPGTDALYFSYGANASDGSVRFLRGATGAHIADVLLPGSQAIEGVKLAANGNLVAFNDGAYHTVAKPPLALSIEYEINLEWA